MAREATGELRRLADGWAALITIQGRKRKAFPLTTCATELEAEERCKAMAGIAARLRRAGQVDQIVPVLTLASKQRAGRPWESVLQGVDAICAGEARDRRGGVVPTFGDWAKDWTSNELARRFPDHVGKKKDSSVKRDEDTLRIYVLPHVKDVRVDEFTLADAESVMANIPATDPRRPTKPLRAGTRRHIAQTMARLMKLAVYPGRYRQTSPIPPGWLPRPDAAIARECVFPDEDRLLLAGRSVETDHWGHPKQDVPIERRMAYAFLMREGMRTNEMANLRWSDVDLDRGRVTLDENKTDDPRDWDMRPDVVEALERWKTLQGDVEPGDRVFRLQVGHLADRLRFDLRRVGVTRSQLFERKTGVRVAVRAHDLRASFVTVSLATGKTERWISDRTGHQSHEMINTYARKARTWNLGDFGPMCDLIPELAAIGLPLPLPLKSQIDDDSQRAQRKPMP